MIKVPAEYMNEAVINAFNAPVYALHKTDSTMRDARLLAECGVPDGTVVRSDFQTAGRGRIDGRIWESAAGKDLLCTVILRRRPVPGFTLRVGLAVARTFDLFLPDGIRTAIKWPNDVLVSGKKLAGILCENSGSTLYVGTGFNIGSTSFPACLADKASSLALIAEQSGIPLPEVQNMLEAYLEQLKEVLELETWHEDVGRKLYRKGELIVFLPGDPGYTAPVQGTIEGLGESGELLFRDAETGQLHRFFSGEFPFGYGDTSASS